MCCWICTARRAGKTGDNIDDGYGYPFLFESEESQNQAAFIWQKIAKHYANETTVMGYDLLNEPIAHYFDKDHFNPKLETSIQEDNSRHPHC